MQIFCMKYGTYKIHNIYIMFIRKHKRLEKFDKKLLSGKRDIIVKILLISYSQLILI